MKTPPTSISLAIDACAALCGGEEIDLDGRVMDFLVRLKRSGWADHELEQVVRGLLDRPRLVETVNWQDVTHR